MSSDDSPRANDNGNTELPTVSATNSDSNHDFFLGTGGGIILGEAGLPSKFLSAKNSIEVHRNKILPNNQSLPNVLKDRGHCLHNLTSTNHGSSGFPHVLRSIFSPLKVNQGSSEQSTVRHSTSSKSSKTVNWAPILPGQSNSQPQSEMENIDSLRPSNTNIKLSLGLNKPNFEAQETQDDGHFPENPTNANPKVDNGVKDFQLNETPDVSLPPHPRIDSSDSILTSIPMQFQMKPHQFLETSFKHSQQPVSCDPSLTENMASGQESLTSVRMHQAEGGNHLNPVESDCKSGACQVQTPPLQQLSVSDYTLSSQPFEGYKSSCLFVPPAENYVYNAQVRLNPSGEVRKETDQMTQNFPVARRDQITGPDMTTIPPKDYNMDNHNYDTDEDLGEPDPQASLLTLVNPKDLPVPDAEYVSRMVSEELHPYIAKKCKKDCRTWLWKSDAQRASVVAKQRLEMEKKPEAKP